MHFSHHLAETLLPEWRQHYINYEALKDKLKQARDASDEFLEAARPLATSLSIPRSVSQQSETVLHALQHSLRQQHEQEHVQQQADGVLQATSSLQQHGQQRASSSGGRPHSPAHLRVPAALQLDGGPAEQFLQLLQQELNKVRDFITAQGSSLQEELQALAAAAPQLSLQDCRQLEQQAHELGRQLLALEAYMHLNQMGFVKICKKHDKCLPESPIWHLYLHHLQRSPWLDDSTRQYMWAALSSCYYHLHAASIYSSRERQQQQQQARQRCAGLPPLPPQHQQQPPLPQQQQQQQQSSLPPPLQQQQQATAGNMQSQASNSSSSSSISKAAGGLAAAFGSAMAGAASAVAGAAGASAAALAAAAGSGSGPPVSQPSSGPATAASRAPDGTEGEDTVRITRKFWVQESDVSAVMYFILQHLPLLPSTSHSVAAGRGAEGSGDGVTAALGGGQWWHQQPQTQQQPQLQPQGQGQPLHKQQQQSRGSTSSLAPQQQPHQGQSGSSIKQRQQQPLLQPALDGFTTTLHTVYFDNAALHLYHGRLFLRPQTQTLKARWIGQGASAHSASSMQQGCSESVRPDKVVLERKIYREGWRGEPNTKDSLLIAGDKLPQYLAGAYTLGDALADLCEVPACKAQLMRASSTVQQKQQRQPLQVQTASPFAQATAAAAAAAVAIDGGGDAADDQAAAALAASIRVPSGFAIGSFSSRSFDQLGSSGSHPSLLQLLEREQQQRQSPEAAGHSLHDGAAAAVEVAAEEEDDELQAGFADAYLDPPVPTADQLSLFNEVQRFVGRMRLRPVLHCVLRRMVFAMPFDDRIRITIDTDVTTRPLDAPPADWQHSAPDSNGVDTVPPGLHASDAAWDAVFSTQSLAQEESPRHSSGREPGSPLHAGGSSGGAAGPVWHPMPYALMKVSYRLPANQNAPDWLQQVMGSEAVIPVEDWSKFIHGCAVLLPEIVRAVPYWMDDELVELSVSTLQAKLEVLEVRRAALLQQQMQAQHRRNSSTGSFTNLARTSSGGVGEGAAGAAGQQQQQQQQQPMLQRLSGSFKAVLSRASSGGGSGRRASNTGSTAGGGSGSADVGLLSLQQQQQGEQPGVGQVSGFGEFAAPASQAGPTSSSVHRPSRLRVTSQDAAGGPRVSWADGHPHSSSLGGDGPTEADTAGAVLASAGGWQHGVLAALWQLVHRKKKPPPLFRPEGSRSYRPRRYNPVHLIESREYLYSEAVFLNWLNLAITLASVAVLLMGYSSMAYVNPLKRPTLHVAEIICLLMLPASCIIVAYAIQSYVWRGKRLHSMRYSRVDDPVGPLAMALVFVACMAAVMMVNIADIVLLMRARDDPGGGDEGGDSDFTAIQGLQVLAA